MKHPYDIVIVGGGTGGCAAAMAACSRGLRVLMTEETDWIGGQLTSQAVPPDEHPWIEQFGCTRSYRVFRDSVRAYYRDYLPLTLAARQNPRLNPGSGWVSRLCFEPRIGVAVLNQMLAPYLSSGLLTLSLRTIPVSATTTGDEVDSVTFLNTDRQERFTVTAPFFLDATETGDLLPMTGTEYVVGQESQAQTQEPSAPAVADPTDIQSFTWCFAMGFEVGGNHVGPEPEGYSYWRNLTPPTTPPWCGLLFSWTVPDAVYPDKPVTFKMFGQLGMFTYRQIIDPAHFELSNQPPVTIVNWAQNDCLDRVIDVTSEEAKAALAKSRQQSLCFFHWLQTEAPRDEGGNGYPELFLAPSAVGTVDGLAMAPYHRESRRIQARFTVAEQHVGVEARGSCGSSEPFWDSVGVGAYRIDLHPSSSGRNSFDRSTYPFQIPLGSLIPKRMRNLLPACKNLGVTHITNGCYRLHPVEWNIGESSAILAADCLQHNLPPEAFLEKDRFSDLAKSLDRCGIERNWPSLRAL